MSKEDHLYPWEQEESEKRPGYWKNLNDFMDELLASLRQDHGAFWLIEGLFLGGAFVEMINFVVGDNEGIKIVFMFSFGMIAFLNFYFLGKAYRILK